MTGSLYRSGGFLIAVIFVIFFIGVAYALVDMSSIDKINKELVVTSDLIKKRQASGGLSILDKALIKKAVYFKNKTQNVLRSNSSGFLERMLAPRQTFFYLYLIRVKLSLSIIFKMLLLSVAVSIIIIIAIMRRNVRPKHLVELDKDSQTSAIKTNQNEELFVFNIRKKPAIKSFIAYEFELSSEILAIYEAYPEWPASIDGKHGSTRLLPHILQVRDRIMNLGEDFSFPIHFLEAAALAHDLGKIISYQKVFDKKGKVIGWDYFHKNHTTFSVLLLQQHCPSFNSLSPSLKRMLLRAIALHHTPEKGFPMNMTIAELELARAVKIADQITTADEKGNIGQKYSRDEIKTAILMALSSVLGIININEKSPSSDLSGFYYPERNMLAILEGHFRKMILEAMPKDIAEDIGIGIERTKGQVHPALIIILEALSEAGILISECDGITARSGLFSIRSQSVVFKAVFLLRADKINSPYRKIYNHLWPKNKYGKNYKIIPFGIEEDAEIVAGGIRVVSVDSGGKYKEKTITSVDEKITKANDSGTTEEMQPKSFKDTVDTNRIDDINRELKKIAPSTSNVSSDEANLDALLSGFDAPEEDVPEEDAVEEDAPEFEEGVPEFEEDAPEFEEDVPEEDTPEFEEDVPEEDAPEFEEDAPEEDAPEFEGGVITKDIDENSKTSSIDDLLRSVVLRIESGTLVPDKMASKVFSTSDGYLIDLNFIFDFVSNEIQASNAIILKEIVRSNLVCEKSGLRVCKYTQLASKKRWQLGIVLSSKGMAQEYSNLDYLFVGEEEVKEFLS